jgi:bifunctional NMN adenylyltransferase/nudix hydrolase
MTPETLGLQATSARTQYEFDFLIFIGRFQPFHNGHKNIIDTALRKARHVIMLLGSAKVARSIRNPFTWQERAQMIRNSYGAQGQARIHCTPLLDLPYAEQSWIRNVQLSVQSIVCQYQMTGQTRIGLIGHSKDHSSYYLKMFPQWENINVAREVDIDATEVRESYLRCEKGSMEQVQQTLSAYPLPRSTQRLMEEFAASADYRNLCHERQVTDRYLAAWKTAPYPPTFVTVDTVVIQSGHILLIKRKAAPGRGLWALPGGFLDPFESLEDAAIRELREETKISVPDPVLRGSIKSREVFDDPFRSQRGRTITTAFLIELRNDEKGLPRIKGADDAEKARWVAIADLESDRMFEDHFHVIQTLLGATFS